MDDNLPLVSIAMPAYNAERYIAQTIESLLSQTYTNFELLIQDDGSTDRTCEIVRSFDDPRIKLECNESNKGTGATRNSLINRAKGKYLAVADSDDIYMPDRLRIQVAFMENNPDVGICGSYMSIIDEANTIIGTYRVCTEYEHIRTSLLFDSPFANPTVMFRLKLLLDNNLYYSEVRSPADDVVFWGKLIHKLKSANIPQELVRYRKWDSQLSSLHRKQQVDDAYNVMHSQMKLLGVELSDIEASVFCKVVFYDNVVADRDVVIFKNILVRLWKGNKKYKVYQDKALFYHLIRNYRRTYKKVAGSRWQGRLNKVILHIQLRLIN